MCTSEQIECVFTCLHVCCDGSRQVDWSLMERSCGRSVSVMAVARWTVESYGEELLLERLRGALLTAFPIVSKDVLDPGPVTSLASLRWPAVSGSSSGITLP